MEVTFRKYERPFNMNEREIIRKFCLSIGILQPGDSRDVIVDILMVVRREQLTTFEIMQKVVENRKKYKLEIKGIAESNIRRQLKRLKDLLIIESVTNTYRMNENAKLQEIVVEKIEKYIIPSIVGRVREYAKYVDELE